MNRIYEINYDLFSTLFKEWENKDYKNESGYIYNNFLVKDKDDNEYFGVDNTAGEWFEEEFKNKTTALIWLTNNEFDLEDAVKEFDSNKNKYKNLSKQVKTQDEFCSKYNLYHRDYIQFDPNKEYDFKINLNGNVCEFSSTIKTAIGFASNYESDLTYKDVLLISPLGFEWEENYKLIQKFLGNNYLKDNPKMKDWGVPYIDETSSLLHFKDDFNIKI